MCLKILFYFTTYFINIILFFLHLFVNILSTSLKFKFKTIKKFIQHILKKNYWLSTGLIIIIKLYLNIN